MKHFRSEHAFEKYKPHVSWRKKILRLFRKKQYSVAAPNQSLHYKSNPFKAERRQKQRSPKLKLIILLILLISWAACLAYLPYFRINKVNYFGLENNTRAELDQVVFQNYLNKKSRLPLNNYFFVDEGSISKDLYNILSLESVRVTKVFPNELNIEVKEKISSIIYDNGKKYFLLDSEGTAIKYLTDVEAGEFLKETVTTSLSISFTSSTTSTPIITTSSVKHAPNYEKIRKLFGRYPLIYDRRNLEIELKKSGILPTEFITSAITWQRELAEQGRTAPKFFVLDDVNAGMVIDTKESWSIIFQPKNNLDAQIDTFKQILPTIKPKEYIDLRFGEKVYWK